MFKTALAKLLTLKVAAVVVGGLTAGGVAIAATGSLSEAPKDQKPAHATADPTRAGGSAKDKPVVSSTHGPDGSSAGGSPSPSLDGLCRAYLAKSDPERGKSLESPAFTALITAAGGISTVDEYCTARLEGEKTGQPDKTPQPTKDKPEHPTTGKPTTRPAGPPSTPPGR